jgi:hypothetical protein
MNDEWQWWALLLGIGLGIAGYWLVRERLPRREEDLDEVERAAESAWISRTVERMGAEAPPEVVSAVLELHREYLAERVPAPGWAAPVPSGDEADTPVEPEIADGAASRPIARSDEESRRLPGPRGSGAPRPRTDAPSAERTGS